MHQTDEMFSALLDGELAVDEIDTLLQSLDARPDAGVMTSHWSRIGSSMRGQCTPGVGHDILSGVRAALVDEPRHATAVSPTPVSARAASRRMRRRWFSAGAGVAAAASLAMAVVLVPELRNATTPPGTAAAETVASGAVDAPEAVAATDGPAVRSADGTGNPVQVGAAERSAARDDRLNTYFIEYAGHRTVQGIGGPLGYARYAAHNADMRSTRP